MQQHGLETLTCPLLQWIVRYFHPCVLLLLSQFPVRPPEIHFHNHARYNTQDRKGHHQQHGGNVARRVLWSEEIRTINIAHLAHDVDNGSCTSPLSRSLIESGCCPCVDDGIRAETPANVQEGRKITRGDVERRDGDDEPCCSEAQRDRDVETSLLSSVAGKCDTEGDDGANDVGRRRAYKCDGPRTEIESCGEGC